MLQLDLDALPPARRLCGWFDKAYRMDLVGRSVATYETALKDINRKSSPS
jgi:hypothetical protein